MYPTLYDFLFDIFGDSIEFLSFLKILNSFGLFVALAFIISSRVFTLELKRKEKEGLLKSHFIKIIKGEKVKTSQLVVNGIIGFLFGYKLIGVILAINFSDGEINPQKYLISMEGNIFAAILAGGYMIYLKYKEAKKEELETPIEVQEEIHPYQLMGNITIISAVAGIIGAKIFHNLENLDEFLENPMTLFDPFSGLTFYGGLIFGGLAVVTYAKKKGMKVIHLLDASAPVMIAAYGIGRIGCHVSGDGDWGIANPNPKPEWLSWAPDWAWAYNYPNNVLNIDPATMLYDKFGTEISRGFVFPTPLYEIVIMVIIFIILWNFRKKIKIAGIMFGIYLIFSGLERLMIEKIRVNEQLFGTSITQAEIISSIMIFTGVFVSAWAYLKYKKTVFK